MTKYMAKGLEHYKKNIGYGYVIEIFDITDEFKFKLNESYKKLGSDTNVTLYSSEKEQCILICKKERIVRNDIKDIGIFKIMEEMFKEMLDN